jgi:Putative beta-barrel porin 2
MLSRFIPLLYLAFCLTSFGSAQIVGYTSPYADVPVFRPSPNIDQGAFSNLPFQVGIFTSVGYDDNIFLQHSGQRGSGITEAAVDLSSHIGNERTMFDLDLSPGFDYYWDRPGRSIDPNIRLTLSFLHRLNPRAYLAVSDFFTYTAQPNYQYGIGSPISVLDYVYDSTTVSFGYQWTPRFSTVTSYTGGLLYYENSGLGKLLDRLDNIFSEQFRFLVLPRITAVAEYRFEYVDYFFNDILNSYTNYALAGLDLIVSPRLTFTFRAGAEIRNYMQQIAGIQNDLTGPFVESTLVYRYRPNSYLEWYNRYGIEESDIGTGYRKTYRTGLQISHAFGERLNLLASAYYAHNQYVEPSFEENVLNVNIGLTYRLRKSLTLSAGYTFDRDFSAITLRDYYRDRVYVGLLFTF